MPKPNQTQAWHCVQSCMKTKWKLVVFTHNC